MLMLSFSLENIQCFLLSCSEFLDLSFFVNSFTLRHCTKKFLQTLLKIKFFAIVELGLHWFRYFAIFFRLTDGLELFF